MRRLTRRQAAIAALALTLAAATGAAALLGQLRVAVTLLGLPGALAVVAILQLRRRVAEVRSSLERVEVLQQRLLETVDQERRAAAEQQRLLRRALDSYQESTADGMKALGNHLVRRQRDATREVEALLQLHGRITPRAPLPSSGHWALNPTGLLELWYVIEQLRPKLVLELGSGTSSAWIAYALQPYHGRLISVDHDPDYAEQTRAQLRRHGLTEVAEVRDAPLCPLHLDGEAYQWYELAAFEGVSDVDLLVVDGPPGDLGPGARYPALRTLAPRLASQATVVLDDADRKDERAIVRRWTETVAQVERVPATVGHLAVLTYHRPAESG